jgi:alkylation response protein AidB-like acyl-CoA dehydrogenase
MPLDFEFTEEQKLIQNAVREFALKELTPERSREYEEKGEFPWDLYRKACALGFPSLHFPEEYGGQGLGIIEHFIYCYEITKADPPLGNAIRSAHFGVELILFHGTHEQKAKWLPKLAKGEITSASMYTEPAGGSDIARILDTKATRVSDREWVINGTKTFITNATTFTVGTVLTQTDPNANPPYRGQTIFLVEKNENIEVRPLKNKMGGRASPFGEVTFDNYRATDNDILGGVKNLNKGFYLALDFLNVTRARVGCHGVATAEAALERAIKYANERSAFGRKISGFQGLAHRIVEMATKVELAKSLLWRTAWIIERARKDKAYVDESIKLASMLKWYGARLAVEACDLAIDVHGGYGYLSDYDVERWARYAKQLELVEGTKEIQKNAIARYVLGREVAKYF